MCDKNKEGLCSNSVSVAPQTPSTYSFIKESRLRVAKHLRQCVFVLQDVKYDPTWYYQFKASVSDLKNLNLELQKSDEEFQAKWKKLRAESHRIIKMVGDPLNNIEAPVTSVDITVDTITISFAGCSLTAEITADYIVDIEIGDWFIVIERIVGDRYCFTLS